MSIQLDRRIRAVEKAVAALEPPKRQVKIMSCPVDGDAAAEARFRAEVDQAVRDGFFVINLVPLQPLPRDSEGDSA